MRTRARLAADEIAMGRKFLFYFRWTFVAVVRHRTTTSFLPWTVAVDHLHPVSRLGQPFAHFFRNHHRAVLAAGAAEGDGQITLAFADVVRQQIDQQLGNALDEFFGLRKRANVLRHLGIASGKGRNSGTKCGLGRKRTSNTRSASSGTPCLKPKLTQETRMFLSDACL